ncbi:hypothetical protein QVD17_33140 [Tagetes erecta]|uniref:Uncharacterized protein n=1 Tax=Tagetes erecta TaxID=13708 RepID=A0AAD8JY47_TARER|nr:hypothetical protein QVD17_33140 [Tagetes erecta]
MENNRLNINRPLLSVRRRPSSQIDNRKSESCVPVKASVESCISELTSNTLMNTGSVPFGWENSPGRPKNEQVRTVESPPGLPKLPPGRFLEPVKKDLVTNVSKITKSESMESKKKESFDSRDVGDNDDEQDEDDDEAYMDALDTLSRGETSFYNCSASGVSGFGSDFKPSGSLPADPKMRDFMMGRFLPAAKAMASDLPQHTFKKNNVKEKPQEVKRLFNTDDNNKMKLRYGPNFLQDVTPDKEEVDNDDDDAYSEYDYNEHGNKSSKFCGLIPRFCSSNPVYGMCVRAARLPIPPAKKIQASSSSSNSFSSEPARNAIYKHRSLDSVLKNESTETSNLEGIKLYNRLQGNGTSVDFSDSFQSTVSEQSDSSPKKKGVSFKELLADKNTNETETDSQESIIEKTLYVDTVQIIKSPQENQLPSCPKPQPISNESLKPDVFADQDLDTKQCEEPETGLEVIDDINGDKQLKASRTRFFELPAPPPLPKTPSDSWLFRTLPSVSSRNTHMRWNQKYPSSNTLASDPKPDENIRLRLNAQGQLKPIPES